MRSKIVRLLGLWHRRGGHAGPDLQLFQQQVWSEWWAICPVRHHVLSTQCISRGPVRGVLRSDSCSAASSTQGTLARKQVPVLLAECLI